MNFEKLAQSSEEAIGLAISKNNMAVLELKNQNFEKAYQISKQSVTLLETKLFAEIRFASSSKDIDLKSEKGFTDRLQVLLISYFNMGMSQAKTGNIQQAKLIFEQGFKMGKRYLGEDHFFTQRFARRNEKPLGNGEVPSPQKSIKHENSQKQGFMY